MFLLILLFKTLLSFEVGFLEFFLIICMCARADDFTEGNAVGRWVDVFTDSVGRTDDDKTTGGVCDCDIDGFGDVSTVGLVTELELIIGAPTHWCVIVFRTKARHNIVVCFNEAVMFVGCFLH